MMIKRALILTVLLAAPLWAQEVGLRKIEKDPTAYALWGLRVSGVSPRARYVEMEVRFPEGTLFNVYARESGPQGETWTVGAGYSVFEADWHRAVFSLGTFPGPRLWRPRSEQDVLIFPAERCQDRNFPADERKPPPLGDGRFSPERIDRIEIEFPATNGWAGAPRRAVYEVRNVRFTEKSPRELLLERLNEVRVGVDFNQNLGAVNPLWKDACHTSQSFQRLGQRMYKVFGAATFGPFYPPQKPGGSFTWTAVDGQMQTARRSGSVVQVVIGRDVPSYLWREGADVNQPVPLSAWKRGHLYPPRDFKAYEEIVYRLVHHINVERKFGVHSFLLWGGADSHGYFLGSMEDYCRTYAACARAVKRADPAAKVGGPSPDPLFNPDWVRELVEFCARGNVPLDFVSLHNYSLYADQTGKAAEWTRTLLRRYERLRNAEIHVDEWNSGFAFFLAKKLMDFKRSAMNAAYAAATFGAMTEAGVQYACYSAPGEGFGWAGTRLEESDGTPRPIYNTFELFNQLEGRRGAVRVNPPESGIGGLAAVQGNVARLALWGYAAERQPTDPPLKVETAISLNGIPGASGQRVVRVWSIDEAHSNLAAGKEHAALERLKDLTVNVEGGHATLRLAVKIPSVMLVEVLPVGA
jgi:hypothetical protein